ncbi:MAG TPA: transglycosylase domain-containing protein [Candidatus Magasanikbacteria bacterium]|nr:transglycosylase domain-containing protein [Candidatus Magasanikbacteria bacterium]
MSYFSNNHVFSPQNWREKTAKIKKIIKPPEGLTSKNKPMKKKVFTFKNIAAAILLLAALGWLTATILIAWASRDLPDPNKLIERSVAQSTKIYDRTGEHVLYEVFGDKKRTLINLEDMPDYAKWATILVEDKNFYQHKGVAWLSIIRAFVNNFLGRSVGRGGASTLTQQLIKNAVLTNEHSYIRKIKEAILARQIEKKYQKDEILKMYLNEIPYGSANYGIEAASLSYFGKSAKDLSVAEAATLAALPQAPTKYLNNFDKLKIRRDFIIDLLLENEKIGEEEAKIAKAEPINIRQSSGALFAPHFVLYIKELVTEKYGEKMVESGGLKIITTLDYDLQKIAEEEVKAGAEKNETKYNANNAALIAMDPKTGQVLAMVGSRDYDNEEIDGQVNVTLRPRQPGSSFKPLVYVAAFEKGLTPDTKLYDVETIFKTETKDFTPHDYDLKERGLVSIRQALAGSLNIPAVKTLYLTGIDTILNLAEKMGYTTLGDRSRFGLALVLGGAEVKLIEHVHGFTVLANEGKNIPYSSILEIRDNQNNVLEKWEQPEGTQVIDTQAVREVTDIMSDNNARAYIFGEKNPLTLPDRPVAAKTGTTNDWHDGWTLGFTPSLVTGVWAGNNNNKEMARGADGVLVAAPIWHNFMARALTNKPVEAFTPPDPYPPETKPILLGQGMGDITLAVNKLNNKIVTASTPAELIEYRHYRQPHSILFYLNKDDLKGDPPADPSLDPQFSSWEEGVRIWASKQGDLSDNLPIEYDDGTASNITLPQIKFSNLVQNQTITTRTLPVEVSLTNAEGINHLTYFIDEKQVEDISVPPYSTTLYLFDLSRGFHNLKAKVSLSNGLTAETNLDFNLTAADELPTFAWLFPTNNLSLFASQFPISLKIKAFQTNKIKKIDIFFEQDGKNKNLSSINEPSEPIIILPWNKAPENGFYTIKSIITTTNNQTLDGPSVDIEIK